MFTNKWWKFIGMILILMLALAVPYIAQGG